MLLLYAANNRLSLALFDLGYAFDFVVCPLRSHFALYCCCSFFSFLCFVALVGRPLLNVQQFEIERTTCSPGLAGMIRNDDLALYCVQCCSLCMAYTQTTYSRQILLNRKLNYPNVLAHERKSLSFYDETNIYGCT